MDIKVVEVLPSNSLLDSDKRKKKRVAAATLRNRTKSESDEEIAVALFDFVGASENELSFVKGDRIRVVDRR